VTGPALRIATRGSRLARWQAHHVAGLIRAVDPAVEVELVIVSTEGDRRLDVPLHAIGGKGTFVKEVQAAVLHGRADLAVHSAKDLPGIGPDGLTIAALPVRGDPRDALVGATLAELGPGSSVGSGSQRRRVQLVELVPGVELHELRGNVGTRVSRVGELDSVVVAVAAMDRLGLSDRISQVFGAGEMLPQVGQGALAVECRTDDDRVRGLLGAVDDPATRRCVTAERGFLVELGGDCSIPAGAFAEVAADGSLEVRAMLADANGRVHRRSATDGGDGSVDGSGDASGGDTGSALGARLARELAAIVGAER